jgi:hypothetical protein
MSRLRLTLVVLLLTAIVGVVPQAQATSVVQVNIAGSSGVWQAMAVGAFNYCNKLAAGCGHWTSASNVINLTDTRLTPVVVDPGTTWIVWNSTATKVWAFTKVDSVVGDHCYFAQPQCTVSGTLTNLSGSGSQQIASAIWGADQALPSSVQALFTGGQLVSAAASDIRPEDGAFAMCRANSILGAGSNSGGSGDNLDGLGYNSVNASGACPADGLGQSSGAYLGTPVKSGYPGSTAIANVVAFNIKGKDPISGTAIPAFTAVAIGAYPIVFFDERDKGQLTDLTNVSEEQLQAAFSGTNCDANAFGLPSGSIGIFLREPLSGTMNTTEATVFRQPTVYPGATGLSGVLGASQESNVNGPVNNPLTAQSGTCLNGSGGRYRALGAGEEINWVLNSGKNLGTDGIGYTFFSYGNVSKLANNPNYAYVTLDNVDPIFASYGVQNSTGKGLDAGQPATAAAPGIMPAAANLPASCSGAFPCPEKNIWAGGLSFPNVRNGTYRAWSEIRLVSNGTALTNVKNLIKGAQISAVDQVPDFVPAVKTVGATQTDPGLLLVRSHYQQEDGAGNFIGAAPVNKPGADVGGDMGGAILPCATTTTCSTTTQQVNGNQGSQARP